MRKTFLCFAAASWLAWSVSVGLAQSSGASGSGGTSEAGAGAAAGGSGAATGTTGSSATNAGNSVNTDNNLNRSTNQMNGAGAPAGQTGANFQGQNQTGSVIPGNAPMGSNAVGRPGAAVDVNTPGSRVGVDANRMGTEVDINRQGVNNNPNGRIDAGGGMNPQAGMNQSSAAGDSWRFQRYNSEWWYWMPGNYWMFYRDNNWSRYDPNTFRPMSRYRTAYRGPLGLNQNGTGVANPSLERLRDDARNLGQDLRQGTQDLLQNGREKARDLRQDLQQNRQDMRQDNRELRQDNRDLRQDTRQGLRESGQPSGAIGGTPSNSGPPPVTGNGANGGNP
jgi:hypothetical protein